MSFNTNDSTLEPPKPELSNRSEPSHSPEKQDESDFKTPDMPASAVLGLMNYQPDQKDDSMDDIEPGEIREARDPGGQTSPKSPPPQATNGSGTGPILQRILTSPYDTGPARQVRERLPHLGIEHPASGITTYGRVPDTLRELNAVKQGLQPRDRNSMSHLNTCTFSDLCEDDEIWGEIFEFSARNHRQQNS